MRRDIQYQQQRSAFTLIEVIVSIAIIGLLCALLVPAVQATREAARKTQCQSNLRQIAIASQNYESDHAHLPPGNNNFWSIHAVLLPYMEQSALYHSLGVGEKSYSIVNEALQELPQLHYLNCPSDAFSSQKLGAGYATSYAGNWGMDNQKNKYNGMVMLSGHNTSVRTADVTDGLSNTAWYSEILVSIGELSRLRTVWELPIPAPLRFPTHLETLSVNCSNVSVVIRGDVFSRGRAWGNGQIFNTGYTHTLGPNQPSCLDGNMLDMGAYSAGSQHPHGLNVMFGDGHLAFVPRDIDIRVWRSWGTRASNDP